MSSFEQIVPKLRKLAFFPASLPDETLYSRVSRYHFLSIERKDEVTFSALFGELGGSMDFTQSAPRGLKTLASLLPGHTKMQLERILRENTLVPFLAPMTEAFCEEYPDLELGGSKACLACFEDDETTYGTPYLHRSHQLPSVITCWRHGTLLVAACPDCGEPFKRPDRFLRAPIIECTCGWFPRNDASRKPVSKLEHDFAKHAYSLLQKQSAGISRAMAVGFFELHVAHSKFKIKPNGVVNRSLLVGLMALQLAEGKAATEVAAAAAKVIGARKDADWWVASTNPSVLDAKARQRERCK